MNRVTPKHHRLVFMITTPLYSRLATLLRTDIITMTAAAGSGHVTSSFSAVELLSVLVGEHLTIDLKNKKAFARDRIIFSKGHASPLLYALWKAILGDDFPADITTLRTYDSILEGHPTHRFPYFEAATGSLGQGLGIATGHAWALKHVKSPGYVYVLLGDSELAEGSNWEAASFASYYGLSNIIAIVDVNRLGQTGSTAYGHDIYTYQKRFQAFGWKTILLEHGHDIPSITAAYAQALEAGNQPVVIIAHTYKGYGLPQQYVDTNGYHGKAFTGSIAQEILSFLKSALAQKSAPEITTVLQKVIQQRWQKREQELAPNLEQEIEKKVTDSTDDHAVIATAPRRAIGDFLLRHGSDKQVIVCDAEVGNSTYTELFEKAYPERFLQNFVAEQQMISSATGIAQNGYEVWVATFAAFLTRAYDQIRMIPYNNISLKIIGTHVGVSIGADGPSQMGLEDMALFRALPNSVVLYPSDGVSAMRCAECATQYSEGCVYIRTTRNDLPFIYPLDQEFIIGGCHVLTEHAADICCVVAAGITVHEALKAAKLLMNEGIYVCVIDAYSLKPLSDNIIAHTLRCKGRVVVVEDHYATGGLGEALACKAATCNVPLTMIHCAVTTMPRSGTMQELLHHSGIDAEAIITACKRHVQN